MTWHKRIAYQFADWITGGELTFHRQTAVRAIAEAQRIDVALKRIKVMLPTAHEWSGENQIDFRQTVNRIEMVILESEEKRPVYSAMIAEERALGILKEALK